MPPVSEKQRKAMYAAASGHSTLGIPQKVGEEFVGAAKDAVPSAAGVMLTDPDGRALFLRRSGEGDHPGEWCWPGGGVDPGETPEEAARREVEEETGHRIDGELSPVDHSQGNVEFSTFAHRLPAPYEPRLNDEHSEHVWAHLSKPPQPLHPGVAGTLNRLKGAQDEGNKGNPQGALNEQEQAEAEKGHADREEMPASAFLEPAIRKYPVKEARDGKWVYSRNLLLAAARRARMQGHESLAARADAIRHREFKSAEAEDKCLPAMDAAIALALDRDTNRNIDGDGHLRVKHNLLTRAEVSPYRGQEINDVEPLGLDPNRIYYLYRLPDELKKGAETLEGKPILIKHKPISSDDHPEELVVGAVSNPELAGDELYGDLSVWTRGAVGAILNGSKKHISLGYHYKPVMTPGVTPKGQKFDGVMKNIRYNHLALVENPRVKDAVVADSSDELLWARIEQALISAFPDSFR